MEWGRDWIKLYKHPSLEWLALPLSVRGMGDELMRVAKSDGRVFVGPDVLHGLMRVLGAHHSERRRVKADWEALLKDGFASESGGYVTVRNYVVAQTTVSPSGERMRKHRGDETTAASDRGEAGEILSSDRADTELIPSSYRARTEQTPRNAESPRNDSAESVTVTALRREEKRREETTPPLPPAGGDAPEAFQLELGGVAPPVETKPATSSKRTPKVAEPDPIPEPGTLARSLYDLIADDPRCGPTTLRPGDFAARLAHPLAYPGVDRVAALLACLEWAARGKRPIKDGRATIARWFTNAAEDVARQGKAAPVTPIGQRGVKLTIAPVSDNFDEPTEDPAERHLRVLRERRASAAMDRAVGDNK